MGGAQIVHRIAVLDEFIGPAHAFDRAQQPALLEELNDRRTKAAAHGVVLHRDQQLGARRRFFQERRVKRLGEPGVDHPGAYAGLFQPGGDPASGCYHVAEGPDLDLPGLAQAPSPADREDPGFVLQRHSLAFPARVTDEGGSVVRQAGGDHVRQLVLVARRHHHRAWHASQVGDVEEPVVGRPVVR